MYMKIAIRKETNAIDKFDRRISSKKLGIYSFIVPPNKIIGIVPIKIDLNIFSCKKNPKNLFEYCLFKLKISFLKYQIKAKTLPIWIIADKDGPGSSIPKKNNLWYSYWLHLTIKQTVQN